MQLKLCPELPFEFKPNSVSENKNRLKILGQNMLILAIVLQTKYPGTRDSQALAYRLMRKNFSCEKFRYSFICILPDYVTFLTKFSLCII